MKFALKYTVQNEYYVDYPKIYISNALRREQQI